MNSSKTTTLYRFCNKLLHRKQFNLLYIQTNKFMIITVLKYV